MKYIKLLSEIEAIELSDCINKPERLKRAKEIIEQSDDSNIQCVDHGIKKIKRAIKYAVYREVIDNKTTYYVPMLVPDNEIAFCVVVC